MNTALEKPMPAAVGKTKTFSIYHLTFFSWSFGLWSGVETAM
jgi:hypothetical protein